MRITESIKSSLTLDVEIIAVPDGTLEENTDGVGQLGVALFAQSGQRVVLVGAVIDDEVTDFG